MNSIIPEPRFAFGKTITKVVGFNTDHERRLVAAFGYKNEHDAYKNYHRAVVGQSYVTRILNHLDLAVLGISGQEYHDLIRATINDVWQAFREDQKAIRNEINSLPFRNDAIAELLPGNSAVYVKVPCEVEFDLGAQLHMMKCRATAGRPHSILLNPRWPERVITYPSGNSLVYSALVPPSQIATEAASLLGLNVSSIRITQTEPLSTALASTSQLRAYLSEKPQ